MNIPDNARLKRDFENLRDDDRRAAPDFLNTVSAARRRAVAAERRRWRNHIFMGAALLFAAATGMMVVSTSHRSTALPVTKPGPLLSWSSPTASLLETPGKRFWSQAPPLGYQGIYGLPGAGKERK